MMDEFTNNIPETNDTVESVSENQPAFQQEAPIPTPQPQPQSQQVNESAPYPPRSAYAEPQTSTPYATTGQQPKQPTAEPQFSAYQYTQPTRPPKNNKNPGKVLFISLICLCLIIASVVVGISASSKNNTPTSNDKTSAKTDSIADANKEDSPISYSEYSGEGPMTAEQVYQEVKDINVGIIVFSQNQKSGEGSGIVVGESKDKKSTYILTAAHVIAGQNVTVQVQFSDGSEVEATVVGLDEKTDIGVLNIKKTGLKAATFGNSSKLSVGQTVYAIGNPGGTEFFGSFTSGTISAIDRPVPTTNSSYDLPCIQHNAAINPGNSGGALVNEYGQVIGLNSSKISSTEYEGMGFAVPGETMLEVYEELVKNGYVSNRPMLGITYYPVSSDYQSLLIASKNGLPYGSVVVATLSNSSDLINHGIKAGDIITAVNGKKLDSTDVLLEQIENAKVGDKLKLTICRINANGTIDTTFEANVKLVEDTGKNGAPQPTQEPTTQDPFSSYFENFGY